jgi:hypothetical protein
MDCKEHHSAGTNNHCIDWPMLRIATADKAHKAIAPVQTASNYFVQENNNRILHIGRIAEMGIVQATNHMAHIAHTAEQNWGIVQTIDRKAQIARIAEIHWESDTKKHHQSFQRNRLRSAAILLKEPASAHAKEGLQRCG